MADAAHRMTDEKLEEMEKRLSAIYSRAEKEMGEQWNNIFQKLNLKLTNCKKAYDFAKMEEIYFSKDW